MEEAIKKAALLCGYDNVRNNQATIIEGFLKGKDGLFVAPTGSGKSFIFETAVFSKQFFEGCEEAGTVLIISPLVSLMKTQCENLNSRGIKAAYIKDIDEETGTEDLRKGKFNLIFGSPESFLGRFRDEISLLVKEKRIKGLFFDEAHCIMKYGYPRALLNVKKRPAFRPAYGKLIELRALAGDVPAILLTATASLHMIRLLKKELSLHDPVEVILPPIKDNITYHVVTVGEPGGEVEENMTWLCNLIKSQKTETPKTLCFFRRIKYLTEFYETVDESLGDTGHAGEERDDRSRIFEMYHLKTDDDVKNTVLSRFCEKEGNLRMVLCSTSFSMGLDVPDVSRVIHYGPPNDTDDFLQETGRAGRGGEKCNAVLILYKRALCGANISQSMKTFLRTKGCRRCVLLEAYMDNPSSLTPSHDCCDNCASSCDCGDCPLPLPSTLEIIRQQETEENETTDSNTTSDSDIEVRRHAPVLISESESDDD